MRITSSSSTERLTNAFILGVGAVALLLGVLRQARTIVSAASLAATIRYVAADGADAGDCGTPTTPCRTIQYAVDRAADGDEVRVATGVYTDIHGRPSPVGYPGPSIITQVVYLTKSLTLRGGYSTTAWSLAHPTAFPTTLNPNRQGRGAFVMGAVSVTLDGFRIISASAWHAGGAYSREGGGGGLYVADATLTITACRIVSSRAPYGGGVYGVGTDVSIHYSQLIDNSSNSGGGIYLRESSATMQENTVENNEASDGGGIFLVSTTATLANNLIARNRTYYGFSGGGISVELSDFTLTGNEIVGNSADIYGGGVWLSGSQAWLSGNSLRANRAEGSGGGLWAWDTRITAIDNVFEHNRSGSGAGLLVGLGTATLSGNRIAANTADIGGGLQLLGGHITASHNLVLSNTAQYISGGIDVAGSERWPFTGTLVNNVVADNRSGRSGSAVSIGDAHVSMLHNTIARNGGDGDSGIWVYAMESPSHLTMTNNILVSHTLGISVAEGNTVTLQGTLWGVGAWANGRDWDGAGAIHTGTVNVWGDPGFRDPDGGDYHLRPGSAAIDAGVDARVRVDIDGDARPALGGFDIGADEFVVLGLYRVALPVLLHDN
jgi:hypothetical protein